MILAKQWLTPRIRQLIIFNVIIMLLFGMVVTYHSMDSYKSTLREAQINAESLANSLADHTELSFLAADMMIRRAIERQYINTLFAGHLNEYSNEQFAAWLKETPQILALSFVDEHGKTIASAIKPDVKDWQSFGESEGGKGLIQTMKTGTQKTVFIGVHHVSDQQRFVVLARRYDKSDGNYGGFVVAALDPRYFADYYYSIAAGEAPYMQVRLGDTVLAASTKSPKNIERSILQSNVIDFSRDASAFIVNTKTARIGNKVIVVSSRQLRNVPVVVSVLLGEEEMLKSWRSSRDKDVGFLALFTLFGTVLSFFAVAMSRHIIRAEQSESSAILASQAKSEFLANMSHELRTPLNAVIGYSEMLNSEYFGPLNHKQKERVNDINLCGTHLLQLINDILEFSKGEAGKLELTEEKVDIAEVINETVRIMNGRARMKNIRLAAAIEPDVMPLWGDRRKIAQMLLNLISNAVKFTPDNGTVRVAAKMDPNHALIVTVSDTGVGIAEEDIPKALSVFGQVHRSQSHEGTGLGLPLCKMYAELHGGKLTLSSKLGAGTTVRVQFPHQRSLLKSANGQAKLL